MRPLRDGSEVMVSDRDRLRKKLAETVQAGQPDLDGGSSSLLLGFVLVAEWVADNGKRWLTEMSSDAHGETLPTWQRNGYLHEALNEQWPESEEGDEEGDGP